MDIKNNNIEVINSPYLGNGFIRVAFVGQPSSGKTFHARDFVKQIGSDKTPIEAVYIFTFSLVNQSKYSPNVYKDIEKYFKEKGAKVKLEQGIDAIDDIKRHDNTLVIFDDIIEKKDFDRIAFYFTRGRGLGCHVILITQNYITIPRTIRECLTHLCLFDMPEDFVDPIATKFKLRMKKEEFMYLFNNIMIQNTPLKRMCMFIDIKDKNKLTSIRMTYAGINRKMLDDK